MTNLHNWKELKKLGALRPIDAYALLKARYKVAEAEYEKTYDPYADGWLSALDYAMQVVEKIRVGCAE